MTRDPRRDATSDQLLDHEADGIREFDNALPRWWLYGFYFTIVFAAVYMVNYHVLARPLFDHASIMAEYQADVEAAARERASRPRAASAAQMVLTDADSLAKGRALYDGPDHVCFSCHRPDMGGLVGPDLTDDFWKHGCTASDIAASIRTGYPLKGMLPYGVGKPMTDEQVQQVVSYVISKRRSSPPNPRPVDADDEKPCPARPN